MFTETQKKIMKKFIHRLLNNPSLKNEPKLVIEENIIQFFTQNRSALKATFSTPEYFPNLNFIDVQTLFYGSLIEEINIELLKYLKNNLLKKINFQFMNQIVNRQIPHENYKNDIFNILSKVIDRYEIRRNLQAVIRIIEYNLTDKYIHEAFEKKAYIARQITFVERLKFQPEYVSGLIKLTMLISLLGYIRPEMNTSSFLQKNSAPELMKQGYHMQRQYYEKIIRQFLKDSKYITEDIIMRAICFHLNFNDNRSLPATSRIAKILSTMGKTYKPKIKIDKGADTFEKSWFQSQRKNYKYFGFDVDMLDELYRISAENFW